MGCFSVFPCFTKSKNPKSVNPTTTSSSLYQVNDNSCDSIFIKALGSIQNPIRKSRDDSEDQLINGSYCKTVTLGLDYQSKVDISVGGGEDSKKDVESLKLGFLVQLENIKERKTENEKLGVLVHIENENAKKKEHESVEFHVEIEDAKEKKEEPKDEKENLSLGVDRELDNGSKNEVEGRAVSDSSVSSYISHPPMHRYHNCVIKEDEEDEVLIQEESSESLFSVSINQRTQPKSCPIEVDVDDDKEVNSPLKLSSSPELVAKSIESCHDQNVLNPIENLTQWKILKSRPMFLLDQCDEKENINLKQEEIAIAIPLSEEPMCKVSNQKGKVKTDTAVTTSLSSWLVEPEKSTTTIVSKEEESQFSTGNSYSYSDGATSWKSFED
ncbi:uncharacterized protein, partial [Rutidosis leptorrhynchoides]|uniref:uncharacterized protein n=1 Tax=Rutidosis leptorrhynchoides TaxID=125765 RepID=UPI003A9A2E3F